MALCAFIYYHLQMWPDSASSCSRFALLDFKGWDDVSACYINYTLNSAACAHTNAHRALLATSWQLEVAHEVEPLVRLVSGTGALSYRTCVVVHWISKRLRQMRAPTCEWSETASFVSFKYWVCRQCWLQKSFFHILGYLNRLVLAMRCVPLDDQKCSQLWEGLMNFDFKFCWKPNSVAASRI